MQIAALEFYNASLHSVAEFPDTLCEVPFNWTERWWLHYYYAQLSRIKQDHLQETGIKVKFVNVFLRNFIHFKNLIQ